MATVNGKRRAQLARWAAKRARIVNLYRGGLGVTAIGRRYGISRARIYQIIHAEEA